MTILAGAFSLIPNGDVPRELRESLRLAISRFEGETVDEISEEGFFLAKVDIGAFGAKALLRGTDGSVTAVAGEPLLEESEHEPAWDRSKDVAALHPLLEIDNWDGLARCRGTFCGVHYSAERRALSLFVDKVGVRPIYMWAGPEFVVFSTALRILEAVQQVPKEFDVRGVTEIATFEYPLADRTPYLGIRMLRAGEVVTASQGKVANRPYWRWDGEMPTAAPYKEAVARTYREFVAAITRRQRGGPVAAAFLSGGLDSRAIVGGLHAVGCEVHTVNYAPDGSQDQVFAKLIAEKLGVHYSQLHTNADNVVQGYRKTAVQQWVNQEFSKVNPSERSPMFWSGDGGSVALGHVYLSPAIVEAMERGDSDQALTLMKRELPPKVLQRSERSNLVKLPARGVAEELALIDCKDPGRAFHHFLMFNDQRRHLAQHFEDIDLERIEFQLPFFDADFLDTILRAPCAPFLKHHFYMDWLAHFPNQLASVPWQAYPGHAPCTLPSPPDLKLQWERYYDETMYRQMSVAIINKGRHILASDFFPSHLIGRGTLLLAVWITRLGWRDYSYLIRTAGTYHRYWEICAAKRKPVNA